MDERITKQIKVATEIVDTEIKYVEKLKLLNLLFLKRAKVLKSLNKEIMTDKEMMDIFMNLEEICELNSNMCSELVELRYQGTEEFINGISMVLLKFAPFMKMYTTYMDKYPKALETLETLKKKTSFSEFIKINEMCADDEISSLLILPVQRIPRYILLVKELLKVSRGLNEKIDKKLEENIVELEKTANTINSNVKKTEAREKVIQIQQNFFRNEINIVAPHRYVVAIGKLPTYENSALFKKKIWCLFVLFNDMLLWASVKNNAKGYKLKHVIPLERLNVTPVKSVHEKMGESSFVISCKDIGFKTVDVITKDEESRNKWLKLILAKKEELIEENQNRGTTPKTIKELEDIVRKEKSSSSEKTRSRGISINRSRDGTDQSTIDLDSQEDIWTI